MSPFFFWKILLACLIFSFPVFSWELSREEAEVIGKRIYANECAAKAEKLVWWNDGENFASLGIGHFIWYPAGKKGPFEETFPSLLAFLIENGVEIPTWLKTAEHCPWSSKEEYSNKTQDAKKKELQAVLARSIPLQVMFIAKRFELARDEILTAAANEEQKNHISKQIEALGQSLQGKYALLDFLNFKGRGIAKTETYRGEGWGLKQVLEKMSDKGDSLSSFVETAKSLLKRRVQNAPPERNEERWLTGWLARIDNYLNS
jgi:hypothetical protein